MDFRTLTYCHVEIVTRCYREELKCSLSLSLSMYIIMADRPRYTTGRSMGYVVHIWY
jgi:hypothetical protein